VNEDVKREYSKPRNKNHGVYYGLVYSYLNGMYSKYNTQTFHCAFILQRFSTYVMTQTDQLISLFRDLAVVDDIVLLQFVPLLILLKVTLIQKVDTKCILRNRK